MWSKEPAQNHAVPRQSQQRADDQQWLGFVRKMTLGVLCNSLAIRARRALVMHADGNSAHK